MVADTLRLAVALADAAGRFGAAQRLAAHVGADALVILVEDEEVDAFVPASGFSTLPGGAGWRDLLALVRRPGLHRGIVSFPTPEGPAHALAYAGPGIVLVFIGGTPDTAVIDELGPMTPLIASTLRAEQNALAARGDQRVALHHAREAAALAAALDAARSELEGALRALEDRSRALDRARERAEAAVRAKDQFLAMLGHELRNPLSPIMTALQLLRLKGQIGREHEIIERQVRNVVRLVDDLLDVSRLTTGKIALRTELIEVSDVAVRAIEMVSPMLERKRQVLSVKIPPRGLIVEADPTRLAQVFANLLTNAAKYSDEGTRIALQASGDDAHVRIGVTDEGIGISREMLDRVFDLFEQQRQAIDRSQGGLGLGLAIVRSLVTLHGGTVWASSKGEGQGAEFVVELPRAAAARAPVPHARTARVTVGAVLSTAEEGRWRVVVRLGHDAAALKRMNEWRARWRLDSHVRPGVRRPRRTNHHRILGNRPIYAAPRMSQLRKSSSAASQSLASLVGLGTNPARGAGVLRNCAHFFVELAIADVAEHIDTF